MRTSDTGQPWNTSSVNLTNIIGLLRGRGEDYQYTVIKNFCKEMFNRNFTFNEVKLNYFFWAIAIGVMFILLYRMVEIQKRKKLATYAVIMYLGMFVYTLGLLLLYIFTYSEYEAVHIASFQRYLSTWIVGIFVFGGGVLFGRLADWACWKRVICIGGIGCLMIPILPKDAIYEYTIYRNQNIMATIEYRKQYEGIEKYIPILDYSVDCVHIVAQNSEGGEWLNCSFAITPVRTIGAWSLGELYYEEDFYTRNYTLEEYLQVLNENKCTYVYLAKIDEQFVNGYEGAFEDKEDIEQGCMYKIERMGNRTYLTKVKI